MIDLNGKKILITGASKGLGLVCTKLLDKEGAHLVLMARSINKLEEIRKSLNSPDHHLCLEVDLTNLNQLKNGIKKTEEYLGDIDVVLHVAGGGLGLRDTLLSSEDFEKLFALNFKAIVEINHLLIPKMIKRGKGNVVHIGSISSSEATGSVGYNTVKAALAAYVRTLGRDIAYSNVIATGILPGSFYAPENSWARFEKRDPEGLKRVIQERLPRGRLGDAQEMIHLISFLCSEKASMMSGCLVPIDAGEGKSYLI